MSRLIRRVVLASAAGLALLLAAPDPANAQYGYYWSGYGYSPYTSYSYGYAPYYGGYSYVPYSYYRAPYYSYYGYGYRPYRWSGWRGWGYSPRRYGRGFGFGFWF